MTFHINDKGNAGRCKAEYTCPFGGREKHFSTRAEAIYHAEETLTNELGGSFGGGRERVQPNRSALDSLSSSARQKIRSERDRDFKDSLRLSVAKMRDWGDAHSKARAAMAYGGIALASAGIMGGGFATADAIADNQVGDQTVTQVVEHEGVVTSFSTGKGENRTIEVDLDGNTVTISGDNVIPEGSDALSGFDYKIVSEESVGDTITLTDVTYENSSDGSTHEMKNLVMESNTGELAQKAAHDDARGDAESWGLAGGVALGGLPIGMALISGLQKSAMGRGGSSSRRPGMSTTTKIILFS